MKVIKCELCGSTEVIKNEGLYQCVHCKTRYTAQEASKLLTDVQIDRSIELENYLVLARRAKTEDNVKDAQKYYELALQISPDNWEAAFYYSYFSAVNTTILGIENAIQKVINSTSSVLQMVDNENDTGKIEHILAEITENIKLLGLFFYSALEEHYLEYKHVSGSGDEFVDGGISVYSLEVSTGLLIEQHIKSDALKKSFAPALFEYGIELLKRTFATRWEGFLPRNIQALYISQVDETAMRIRKYKPEYMPPKMSIRSQENSNTEGTSKKEGCYIATAVYGDYNHPKVLVLRGYRDNVLQKSVLGRLFIKFYYKVSPFVANSFVSHSFISNISKSFLDKFADLLDRNKENNT